MREFEHGGDIFQFAKEADCNISEIIDLSSNINFVKPKIDIDFNSLNISSYPNYQQLTKKVAEYYQLQERNIELFNGATVAIDALLRNLRSVSQTCIIYSPAYLEYKRVAQKYSYQIELFDRFLPSKAPPKNSVVIFVNPSTPDGRFYEIKEAIKLWDSLGCKIIVDESFLDFYSLEKSITPCLNLVKELFVIKSMTKFFGSAGVRVGLIIARESFVIELKEREPLWKISAFDSAYIVSALEDLDFPRRSREANFISKRYLIDGLKELKGKIISKIYPSSANFLLLQLKMEAKTLQDMLISQKIMIRDCSNFDYLDGYFARVAVKDIESLGKFIDALRGIESWKTLE